MDPVGFIMILLVYMAYNRKRQQVLVKGVRRHQTRVEIEEKKANPDALNCFVWEIRLTQQNLVEAGVITEADMSVCDDSNCPNCQPTRNAIEQAKRQKALEAKRSSWQKENDYHAAIEYHNKQMLAVSHASDHKPTIQIGLPTIERIVSPRCQNAGYVISDRTVLLRPEKVPLHAKAQPVDDSFGKYIGWTWDEEVGGRKVNHGYKVPTNEQVVIEIGCGCEQINANGRPILFMFCPVHNLIEPFDHSTPMW